MGQTRISGPGSATDWREILAIISLRFLASETGVIMVLHLTPGVWRRNARMRGASSSRWLENSNCSYPLNITALLPPFGASENKVNPPSKGQRSEYVETTAMLLFTPLVVNVTRYVSFR